MLLYFVAVVLIKMVGSYVHASGSAFAAVPAFFFLWMHRVMNKNLRNVRLGKQKRVAAYRDFSEKFG